MPALTPDGPIKGAIALANSLVKERATTLVSLKIGSNAHAPIDPCVRVICLADISKGIYGRHKAYCELLKSAGGRPSVASISICLSPDLLNLFCRHRAVIFSSIRANNLINYRMIYGLIGVPLAVIHLVLLRGFDHIVSMNSSMDKQVEFYSKRTTIIGNFVDEGYLDICRAKNGAEINHKKFVFLGTLTNRKQPILLIRAMHELRKRGLNIILDLIGDGPLMGKVKETVKELQLEEIVTIHGQLKDPFPILSKADAFILPSLSEGVSRAAMEALYLGVPVILRNVGGNSELVESGANGELFECNEEMLDKMVLIAQKKYNSGQRKKCILPDNFRQKYAVQRWTDLIDSSFSKEPE